MGALKSPSRVTVAFGDKAAFPALRKIVADRKSKLDARQEALTTLLNSQDAELPPLLLNLLDDESLRKAAILGLARFDSADTPAKLLAAYAKLNREERDAAIATLASRIPFAHALVDAVVAWGDADAIVARIHEHLAAGADHVCLQPVTAVRPLQDGPDHAALDVLRRLAPALHAAGLLG